jgi:methionyl-tRNA formyltransferase
VRVLFWGTPEFALPSLRALSEEGHEIVGVVTRPDRPAGRGRRLTPSPVKLQAEAEGIPVLQPETPREPGFVERVRALAPEISVVVAYGAILPRDVLEVPARGSWNVHASLLPELRGAAPVPWAILRGYTRTGVTILRMDERLDAGPILYQVPIEIGPETTAGELEEQLASLGAAALVEALQLLEAGELRELPQDESRATYAPKLTAADARLDWSADAEELSRRIRAFDPEPGAWTELAGQRVKVFRPEVLTGVPGGGPHAEPGTVVEADAAGGVVVATGRGWLRIHEVQPAGRRRMSALDWVRGRGVRPGDRLG